MKKASVYSAEVKGTFTQIKAYKKENAVKRFQQLDENIRMENVKKINAYNSHQAPVEELYPELFL
jgi:hypothetical protein